MRLSKWQPLFVYDAAVIAAFSFCLREVFFEKSLRICPLSRLLSRDVSYKYFVKRFQNAAPDVWLYMKIFLDILSNRLGKWQVISERIIFRI